MSEIVLQPQQIEATIQRLRDRISERFPGSGLSQVSLQLWQVSRRAEAKARWLGRPILRFRLAAAFLILLLLAAVAAQFYFLDWGQAGVAWSEFFQGMEAATQEIIFVGAAIFFLATMETRYKRRAGLKSLHELRSLAHVIDMHQLTKDPERAQPTTFHGTPSSPKMAMDSFQLRRYLDYCSELLSLTGKIAAQYVAYFDDAVLVSAVNEIETLTSDLSRKIWQKIMILHSLEVRGTSPPAAKDSPSPSLVAKPDGSPPPA